MSVTPNALLNRGEKIILLDGREAVISFDLEALAQIEEDFGSLGGWQDALNKISTEQMNAKFLQPLLKMLRAGLMHDPSARAAQFDPQRLEEYFKAVMGAAERAFPQAAQGNQTNSNTNVENVIATNDFPGPTSITSLPSDSVEPTQLSGV